MKIASDIDQVLSDIVEGGRPLVARDHGVPVEAVVLSGVYARPYDIMIDGVRTPIAVDHAFWDRAELLENCPIIPGAVEAMWRLDNAGLLVGYVTRRPPHVRDITIRWMSPFPPRPTHFVGTSDVSTHYAVCKSTACRHIGATHLIDDHATEISTARAAGIEIVVVDAFTGREARHAELASWPASVLVPDVSAAVDHLIGRDLQAA